MIEGETVSRTRARYVLYSISHVRVLTLSNGKLFIIDPYA